MYKQERMLKRHMRQACFIEMLKTPAMPTMTGMQFLHFLQLKENLHRENLFQEHQQRV
jgi:hypothetical protein